jgi:hypothetical protein
MSDEENFLERWSRRKAEAQRDAAERPAETDKPAPALADPAAGVPPVDAPARPSAAAASDQRAFDLASLPSLDSITAATDIRAFLKPGVPAELARAALRRAWAADPAIRDFRGLQENDWDFTDPDNVPGFGRMVPSEDVKKMVAQLFGDTKPETKNVAEATDVAEATENMPEAPPMRASHERPPIEKSGGATGDASGAGPGSDAASREPVIVQREGVVALQDKSTQAEAKQSPLPRRHGGALPE